MAAVAGSLRTSPAGGRPWVAPLATALAVIAVRLPSLTEPRWFGDEGVFTAVAMAMRRGHALYAGAFDNNAPGIFLWFRGLLALGASGRHWIVQLTTAAMVVASALLTMAIALRCNVDRRAATWAALVCGIVLSLPPLDGDLVNVEIVALPFFLGALALSFSDRPAANFSGGALLAAALFIRPTFACDATALLVPLLALGRRRHRALILGGLGLALALAILAASLWILGGWTAFLHIALPEEHAYLLWSNRGSILSLVLRVAVLVSVAGIALARARTAPGRLLAVWLPLALIGATLTPRQFPHYIQEAVPPLALWLVLCLRRLQRWTPVLATVAVVVVGEVASLAANAERALLTGTAPTAMRANFAWAALPGYYAGWVRYVVGADSLATYERWFPAPVAADNVEAARLLSLAGSHPGALLVLGDAPWLYAATGLAPATRYITVDDQFPLAAGGVEVVKAAIARRAAPVVVVAPSAPAWAVSALQAAGYGRASGLPWPAYVSSP